MSLNKCNGLSKISKFCIACCLNQIQNFLILNLINTEPFIKLTQCLSTLFSDLMRKLIIMHLVRESDIIIVNDKLLNTLLKSQSIGDFDSFSNILKSVFLISDN